MNWIIFLGVFFGVGTLDLESKTTFSYKTKYGPEIIQVGLPFPLSNCSNKQNGGVIL